MRLKSQSEALPLAEIKVLCNSPAVWSCSLKRVVEVVDRENLPSWVGVTFSLSMILGATIAWSKCKNAVQDSNLEQSRQSTFNLAKGLTLLSIVPLGIAAMSVVSPLIAVAMLCSVAAGLVFGIKVYEYYQNNSEYTFQQWINSSNLKNQNEISFQSHSYLLRCLNLSKLRTAIEKNIGFLPSLNFQNTPITDADLNRLGEAGWLGHLNCIDISQNLQLTLQGLKVIGRTANSLKELNLSNLNITDADLQQLAESGYFNNLKRLNLSQNPGFTGKGLAFIASKGFENLEMLDISYNPNLLGKNLDDWIGKGSFQHLKAIQMVNTNLTEQDLKRMIDEMDWFRNLEGINVNHNSSLTKFPDNISKLTKLRNHEISSTAVLSGGTLYFRDQGLFFIGCSLELTSPIKQLMSQDRATQGGVSSQRATSIIFANGNFQ